MTDFLSTGCLTNANVVGVTEVGTLQFAKKKFEQSNIQYRASEAMLLNATR
jgi:hypothetical protein